MIHLRWEFTKCRKEKPIYTQFQENKDMFKFITQPQKYSRIWKNYQP